MDKNDREWGAWILFGGLAFVALVVFPIQSMYRHLATAEADARVLVAQEINEGLTNLATAIAGKCVDAKE